MEEVKIWAIEDASEAVPLRAKGEMDSESLLEETLVKNPGLLLRGLTLVGRQTPTAGGGSLDLLGVDEFGKLVVFELKRGNLSRDAVAQIIDYASHLEAMDPDVLAEHISDRSGEQGIEKIQDFREWYSEHYPEAQDGWSPIRMFLVGLGTDDTTERMVKFLANSSMDISLLTFYGFEYEGKTLLAKQERVEGGSGPEPRPSRQYLSVAERKAKLDGRLEAFGISDLFQAARDMFRENWPGSSEYLGQTAVSVYLSHGRARSRSYARIDSQQGNIRLVFYGRTVELCPDEFDQTKAVLQFDTYRPPSDADGTYSELSFRLDADEWEIHKEHLYALTQAVYEARRRDQQGENAG